MKFIQVLILVFSLSTTLYCQNIGFVDVINHGAYMVQMTLIYNLNGQDYIRSTGPFPFAESRSIVTPFGATNLRLNIQYLIFIGLWQDLIVQNLPSTNKCFIVYGTAFNPTWSAIDC